VGDWEQVLGVCSKAARRMMGGKGAYGEFNPATDTRDLLLEAQEELLDAINYLAMQYLKLESLKNPKKPKKEPK